MSEPSQGNCILNFRIIYIVFYDITLQAIPRMDGNRAD